MLTARQDTRDDFWSQSLPQRAHLTQAVSMGSEPSLSIVTPTRGNFSDMWYDALLQIQGEVEFLVIYPPQVAPRPCTDRRVRVLTSARRGEVSQRLLGLQQARGTYVLALDDDDYAHP